MKTPTVLERLAQHLLQPVSTGDRQRATVRLADWAGCAVAGAGELAGQMVLKSPVVDAEGQAFAWGALGNILEMDDVDKRALLHPGPVIIPAALALAIELGAPPERLLDAVVRGYEATIRLGRAVGAQHYALWHNTGTCGTIGASAACAFILGLSPEKLAHAMALGVSQSAGFWQTRHEPASHGKQLHTAHAARAGVTAARLAAAGFCGPLTILEGGQGFFAATCPGADPEIVLAPYECEWLIHDVSTKPWPACRHTHAAIDAALALRAKSQSGWTGEIVVATYRDALKFCDNVEPRSVIEAKFSLQHAVAVVFARGAPKLEDFALTAIDAPELAELRNRIVVEEDGALTQSYPAHFGACVTAGGKALTVADAWGDPENPVSDADVFAKSHALFEAYGWSFDESAEFLGAVRGLQVGGSLQHVTDRLKARL